MPDMNERRTILAEYFTTETETLLFGVRPDFDRPEVVSLSLDQSELQSFVRTSFGEHNQVRELIDMGLEELWHRYDYLVEPIARWAAPGDIVYVIPHGLLHYVPMHALKLENRYLVERNPVILSPSASALKYCKAKRKRNPDGTPARRTAAILGDSRTDLPYAHTEATALSELFGVAPVLGDDVTRAAFERAVENVDIVHFAGHSDFDASQPLRSGLRLAGDDTLTSSEVFGLKGLHAHLVTLSGCETA